MVKEIQQSVQTPIRNDFLISFTGGPNGQFTFRNENRK